jgi:hypothetical protein
MVSPWFHTSQSSVVPHSYGISHDYIADMQAVNHGQKFKSFREWSGSKYVGFMEEMIGYANYVKDQRSEEGKSEKAESPPVIFTAGPGELPLLPAPVPGARSMEIARHAKEIVRAYFLRHYRKVPHCFINS